MKDYYKILGVEENSTDDDIKRAYRNLSKQFHPDVNPQGTERFKEIADAYENIGTKEKREQLKGSKIVTSYGGVYSTEPSILKKVLTDLYSERKKYKKESFSYKMLADSVKQKLKTM